MRGEPGKIWFSSKAQIRSSGSSQQKHTRNRNCGSLPGLLIAIINDALAIQELLMCERTVDGIAHFICGEFGVDHIQPSGLNEHL